MPQILYWLSGVKPFKDFEPLNLVLFSRLIDYHFRQKVFEVLEINILEFYLGSAI